jgi:diguanylate cyclase (GGDEF)-like protein
MGKYMEYICMYFACASMIEFVAVFLAGNNERKFFWILGKFFWGLSAVLILLNITNIRHFPKTVIFFQLFSLLSAIGIIYMIAKASVKKRRAEQTFLSGIVVFFLSVVLELVRYRYNKMCVPENVIDQSFIPVGAMLFIVFMAGGFFYRILEHVEEELERKTLYDMAFQDAMTGIRNRAWCEKVMHEFQAEKMPVTIINMDLNLFKEVNDTYGHSVGDDLLIEFAGILSEVFKSAKCVGRMGGDEFVVITQRLTEEEIRAWIRRLIAAIEKENEIVERPYKISVSYGYASSEDGETSPWHVYEQADKQMYEYKKKNREMK